MTFDEDGHAVPQETPYPESNLFSLASGEAIFVRDPYRKIVAEQLNGGQFFPFTTFAWEMILPYLKENECLFGISIDEYLLTVDGGKHHLSEVYRTITAVELSVLTGNEEWVEEE